MLIFFPSQSTINSFLKQTEFKFWVKISNESVFHAELEPSYDFPFVLSKKDLIEKANLNIQGTTSNLEIYWSEKIRQIHQSAA